MTLVFGVNNCFSQNDYITTQLLYLITYSITLLNCITTQNYITTQKYVSTLHGSGTMNVIPHPSTPESARFITERIVCVDCRNKHCFSESNGSIPNEQVPSKLSNWSAGESMQVKENHFHVLSRSDYMVLTSFFYRPCALNGWYCQYRSGDFISHNISLYIKKLCWRVQ